MGPANEVLRLCWAMAFDDLRDHIPTPDEGHEIPDPKTKALHLPDVVQGDVLHGHATNSLRCDTGHWRDGPRSSGLPIHPEENRSCSLRWELPRNGPPRMMCGHPQARSRIEVIHLQDDPVNLVGVGLTPIRPSNRLLGKEGW